MRSKYTKRTMVCCHMFILTSSHVQYVLMCHPSHKFSVDMHKPFSHVFPYSYFNTFCRLHPISGYGQLPTYTLVGRKGMMMSRHSVVSQHSLSPQQAPLGKDGIFMHSHFGGGGREKHPSTPSLMIAICSTHSYNDGVMLYGRFISTQPAEV